MVSLRRTLAVLFFAMLAAGPAAAGGRPVVVELFTSQGCSSCPPADALLSRLAHRGDIIAISLPITYWDMLGWKDTLATDANTRRQKAYAAAMGHGGVYTPQIIVDGSVDVVGSRANNVELAIMQRKADIEAASADVEMARAEAARLAADQARAVAVGTVRAAAPPRSADPLVPVSIRESPQELQIDIAPVSGVHNATVWLVHLRGQVPVKIGAGENQGHTVVYTNVAADIRAVGVFKGKSLHLTLPRSAFNGLPHDGLAVLVQKNGYGHVIGAAFVSRPDYYAAQ
ncbi:MAG: DUF1223 domain-containing protein [Proteobacteria bacterium]|nr:DUF1223 domain-containing protein [Pseudomonadota bacterium]